MISGFTAYELLQGAESKLEAKRTRRLIDEFPIYWPLTEHAQRGLDHFSDVNLSHGVGIIDMLIAQTAIGIGAILLTFNGKHFSAILDLDAVQPYDR